MSLTDEPGLESDAQKLSALLSKPAEVEPTTTDVTLVPQKPQPLKQAQRNVVPPASQPAAEEPSGEGEEDVEGQEAPIDAPASWDQESKKIWAKLPEELRTVVSAREAERERAINSKLEEAAGDRRRFESEEAQTKIARQAYEQRLVVLAKQLEATIPAEFHSLKTPQDVMALATRDPAGYNRFQAWRDMAMGVYKELQQVEQTRIEETTRRQNEVLVTEARSLIEKWPEIADPVKGVQIRNELTGLLKSYGFTEQEIAGLSDHRTLLFAKQFMEYKRAAEAAKAASKKLEVKKLPKVAKPGAGEATGAPALSRGQLDTVARSGNLNATAAAMERLLANPQR